MKKNIILFVGLLISYSSLIAQDFERQYANISQEELEMKTFEKDPDAGALVLYDKGKSIFILNKSEDGFLIQHTRIKRIKILNESGINATEISIPFYVSNLASKEKITLIEAITYNLDNGEKKVKALDPRTVYEEEVTDKWRYKKFVLPDVRVGSVIEFKYIIESPFFFNLPDWSFQGKYPCLWSEYEVHIIPFYEYVFIAQGIQKFDIEENYTSKQAKLIRSSKYNDKIYTYVLQDVPAFKSEAYITSHNDYIKKIDFQLAKTHDLRGVSKEILSTWPKLNQGFLKHKKFGGFLKNSSKMAKNMLKDIPEIENLTELKKSRFIINYIKDNFSWDGGYGRYTSKSAKDFFKQKTGNSSDINLFLTATLKAAGIDAKPVLISTRNHGKIKADYPFEHFFNNTIVLIETEAGPFLTDGTAVLLRFDRIPPRCINENGLIVEKESVNWVTLYNEIPSKNIVSIQLSIDPEELTGHASVSIQTTEFEAYRLKNRYSDNLDEIESYITRQGFNKINKVRTVNYTTKNRPYTIGAIGEVEVEGLSDKILVAPFLKFPPSKNVLTEKERTYPLDFTYISQESLTSNIKIPEGYKYLSLPDDFKLDNELISIEINYKGSPDQVSTTGSYVFKKVIYLPQDYQKVKSYFNLIVEKFNEPIVLEEL